MSSNMFHTRILLRLALGAGAIFVFFPLFLGGVLPVPKNVTSRIWQKPGVDQRLPCSQLPGADEILVVMRTGATELEAKLPVHFNTTFLCYPNYVIFSDDEEDFEGHHIVDALKYVSPDTQASHPDFDLWRRLQQHGRAALDAVELSGAEVELSGGLGKPENAGWKLDKWKFLPMLNRTMYEHPDMKWYVFVETDTYIFWTTTLAWLNTLDHRERQYMGAQMQIGEVVFAHGGSAFVLSQASMRAVVELFQAHQREWEDFTADHWAGDCVLGKALADSGTPLTWAWPIFDGKKPGAIDYTRFDYGKRQWCYPTVSSHHLSPEEIEDLWYYEEELIANGTQIVRHKHVFNSYVLPRILATCGQKTDWDNLSGDLRLGSSTMSSDDCRARCEANSTCVQYALVSGKCAIASVPKLGESKSDVRSGWILDRVQHFAATMVPCRDEGWIA